MAAVAKRYRAFGILEVVGEEKPLGEGDQHATPFLQHLWGCRASKNGVHAWRAGKKEGKGKKAPLKDMGRVAGEETPPWMCHPSSGPTPTARAAFVGLGEPGCAILLVGRWREQRAQAQIRRSSLRDGRGKGRGVWNLGSPQRCRLRAPPSGSSWNRRVGRPRSAQARACASLLGPCGQSGRKEGTLLGF